MKKILITGATGFLGSHIIKHLYNDYEIFATKRHNSDLHRLTNFCTNINWIEINSVFPEVIFKNNAFFAVIHCATQYGRKNVENLQTIEANLILPLQILEFCQKYQTLIFINTDTILDKRMSYYTFSKSQFKQWMMFCSSKLVCINMELEHFYGPGDDDTKFVTWLISSFLNKIKQIDLTLGEQTRNFIYIDDVVKAFVLILKKAEGFKNGFYNFQVGSEHEIKIKDLALLIKRLTDNNNTILNIGALPYRENEVMKVNLDTKPLRDFAWSESISLTAGLEETIRMEKLRMKQRNAL